jgi:hypothetical protein
MTPENPAAFVGRFKAQLFDTTPQNFEAKALEAFRFQAKHNPVYKLFVKYLRIEPTQVSSVEKIPFMPISFFKNHVIVSGNPAVQQVFESSGTTGQIRSQHHIADTDFYLRVCQQIFESYYGNLSDYTFLALLPSYLERSGSSLVCMMDYFIKNASPFSGFYLHNTDELWEKLSQSRKARKKTILWGVTFALLDLAEQSPCDLHDIIIMETGGMKGRKEEMVRQEVHDFLCKQWNVQKIHSEYGMTELLSQAYSFGDGVFSAPPWLKIMLRDANDPFDLNPKRAKGGVNVIDLANIESCCFIETGDIGEYSQNLTFSILGRLDNSDLRGCNLMLSF